MSPSPIGLVPFAPRAPLLDRTAPALGFEPALLGGAGRTGRDARGGRAQAGGHESGQALAGVLAIALLGAEAVRPSTSTRLVRAAAGPLRTARARGQTPHRPAHARRAPRPSSDARTAAGPHAAACDGCRACGMHGCGGRRRGWYRRSDGARRA